jgi:phage gp36-like protein
MAVTPVQPEDSLDLMTLENLLVDSAQLIDGYYQGVCTCGQKTIPSKWDNEVRQRISEMLKVIEVLKLQ